MLTQEDKARIEAIEKYLTALNGCINSVCQLPYFTPPKIEEQSYVICADNEDGGLNITVGKEYAVISEEENVYIIKNDYSDETDYQKTWFTKPYYKTTAQQEPKELINESKGERWKPTEVRERYFYISDYGEILGADWFNDYLDKTRHLICNCFETKEAAQEAANKLKQLLKTL